MVHFIGNILTSHTDAAAHPERGVKAFHITPGEAKDIDATGLPVHLEHAGNVKVGEVTRSWNDSDGKKWVLANVDTSTLAGKYVRNDLGSSKPVYSGLSLQHVHREYADGSSTKHGLEVSICKEPRRPGCRIVHTTTELGRYKVQHHRQRTMSAAADTTENAVAVAKTPEPTQTVVAASEAPPTPSATQLMAEVVEASRQNEELQKQLADKTEALQKLGEREEAARAQALAQQTQIAQELGDAVLEHVAKLDPSLANEDTTTAINTLRSKYPKEIARVMEVACCASKHAKKLEEELALSKETNDRKLMEQAYHAAVATRSGCYGVSGEAGPPATETMVPASKRARANPFAVYQAEAAAPAGQPSATILQIQEAYNGLKGTGSTTDAMKSIAGIVGQQRQRGYR